MATAVALIFPDQGTAERALKAARELEHAGDAKFLESGLLVKTDIDKAEMTKDGFESEIFGGAVDVFLGADDLVEVVLVIGLLAAQRGHDGELEVVTSKR